LFSYTGAARTSPVISKDDASPIIPRNQPPDYEPPPTSPGLTTSQSLQHPPATNGVHQSDEQEIECYTAKLDSALQNHIDEEMDSLNEEMAAFTEAFSSVVNQEHLIGSPAEMESLTNDINNMSSTICEYRTMMDENKSESKELRNGVLSNFKNLDEAILRKEKMEDKRYANVLKTRQLDPVSANQRRNLRAQINHLENTLSEINIALDTKWEEKEAERKKTRIRRPGGSQSQQIYQTIDAIEQISNNLSNRLHSLNLESEESHLITMNTTRVLSTSNINSKKTSDTTKANHSATQRMNQLKNMLSRRESTPARQAKQYDCADISSITGNSILPTPHSKLNPKAASTPAVNDGSFFSPKLGSNSKMQSVPEEANYAKAAAQKLREQTPAFFNNRGTPKVIQTPKAPGYTPASPALNQSLVTPNRMPNINKNLFGQMSNGI